MILELETVKHSHWAPVLLWSRLSDKVREKGDLEKKDRENMFLQRRIGFMQYLSWRGLCTAQCIRNFHVDGTFGLGLSPSLGSQVVDNLSTPDCVYS
jgi:hypothetical protein